MAEGVIRSIFGFFGKARSSHSHLEWEELPEHVHANEWAAGFEREIIQRGVRTHAERTEPGTANVALMMQVALESFGQQATLLALQERVASLESKVDEMASQVAEVASVTREAKAADDTFTEELMDMLSECGGLPDGQIPAGYTVEDPVED